MRNSITAFVFTLLIGILAFLSGVNYNRNGRNNTIAPFPEKNTIIEVKQIPIVEDTWETIKMNVSAYCSCSKCCGEYADGITASGYKIKDGDCFVAAPKKYSFGTEMIVPGYNNDKVVKVLDRGGAIKYNKLDVYFSTHQKALNWGRKYLDIKVRKNNSQRQTNDSYKSKE